MIKRHNENVSLKVQGCTVVFVIIITKFNEYVAMEMMALNGRYRQLDKIFQCN